MNHNNAPATGQGEHRLAFSPDEVAAPLGISRDLVYHLLRTRQLRSVKAGRRRLISRQYVDDFLAGTRALDNYFYGRHNSGATAAGAIDLGER